MQILKKELDNLKIKASKAETIAMAASRKYEDESRKLKELQAQFKAADDIRQEAYEELRNLKKGFYEKVCNHIRVDWTLNCYNLFSGSDTLHPLTSGLR